MSEKPDKYAVNVEIGEALQQEVAKAFRQSMMFEDWLRVLNDEWIKVGLAISFSRDTLYLYDSRSPKRLATHFTLFIDAYREGVKLYNERMKEGKIDE